MKTNSDFEKYINVLNEITNCEKLRQFYNTNSTTIQFFKAIDKSVQDVLGKTVGHTVILKQLENALPELRDLKAEINALRATLTLREKSQMVMEEIQQTGQRLEELKERIQKSIEYGYSKSEYGYSKSDSNLEQKNESSAISANKKSLTLMSEAYKSEIKKFVSYVKDKMPIDEVNEKYEQFLDLLEENEQAIEEQEEQEELEELYDRLVQEKNEASTEKEFQNLAGQFRALNGYEDAEKLAQEYEKQYRTLKELREKQEQEAEQKYNELIERRSKLLKKNVHGILWNIKSYREEWADNSSLIDDLQELREIRDLAEEFKAISNYEDAEILFSLVNKLGGVALKHNEKLRLISLGLCLDCGGRIGTYSKKCKNCDKSYKYEKPSRGGCDCGYSKLSYSGYRSPNSSRIGLFTKKCKKCGKSHKKYQVLCRDYLKNPAHFLRHYLLPDEQLANYGYDEAETRFVGGITGYFFTYKILTSYYDHDEVEYERERSRESLERSRNSMHKMMNKQFESFKKATESVPFYKSTT